MFTLENLQEVLPGAIELPYVPIELRPDGIYAVREETVTYLYPGWYQSGETHLTHSRGLPHAIEQARSCQGFDGGGYVFAVVVPRNGKKTPVKVSPWGKPPPSTADLPELVANKR